jgi:hypothetical protein
VPTMRIPLVAFRMTWAARRSCRSPLRSPRVTLRISHHPRVS